MRIVILSDIHDNVWKLAAALDAVRNNTDAMLRCGDLCSPFRSCASMARCSPASSTITRPGKTLASTYLIP